ncbi:hypothetical protein KDA14_03585, partial [Candidatus Saccharibacteria bacterium]|nr:hypothetical protein [Candidatus Saccharibacteria bacterium]
SKLGSYIAMAMLVFLPAMVPVAVSAQDASIQDSLCNGASLDVSAGGSCETGDTSGKANDLIATVINIFSVIVGVVAVIMIIYGGFRYITSGGDSGKITNAKNTIIYALIGLVVVALAQFIVKFVLEKVTSS